VLFEVDVSNLNIIRILNVLLTVGKNDEAVAYFFGFVKKVYPELLTSIISPQTNSIIGIYLEEFEILKQVVESVSISLPIKKIELSCHKILP
jgi:hypothetical protein